MDFSINVGACRMISRYVHPAEFPPWYTVQAVDRALVVDVLPTGLQPAGNAWAATMFGAGGVSGYFVFVPISIMFVLPTKS